MDRNFHIVYASDDKFAEILGDLLHHSMKIIGSWTK